MTDTISTRQVLVDDDYDAIYEHAYEQGWTDGLPIVPPTPERVRRLVEASGRPGDEIVAVVPPKRGTATIEKIAINAVMAGCRPEYMPVILAAVRAMTERKFELYGINTTTNPVAPLTIVNGPIRDAIGLNSGYGVLGPGFRANATIGRAISLINLNLGGRVPGEISKATHAQPGRFTFCLAEREEDSPWEPLHVERGLPADQSAVTLMAATGTTNVLDLNSKSGRGILTTMAHSMEIIGSVNMFPFFGLGEMLVLLCPDHANVIARDGFSKQDAKEFLLEETSRIPLSHWPEEKHGWLTANGRAVNGYTPLANRPDQFVIVVCGGAGGFHSQFIPTFGDSWATTKPIEWR